MSKINKVKLFKRLKEIRRNGYAEDNKLGPLWFVLGIEACDSEYQKAILIYFIPFYIEKGIDMDIILMALGLLKGYENLRTIGERRLLFLNKSNYIKGSYRNQIYENEGNKETSKEKLSSAEESLRKKEEVQIEKLASGISSVENIVDFIKEAPKSPIYPLPSYLAKSEEPELAIFESVHKPTGLKIKMRIGHNMPVALETFTDRDDKIGKIGERLQKFGWTFISGIGGIGKTELAKEYVHRNKEKYNTVCFLSYDGSLLSTIGIHLPVPGYEPEDENIEYLYNVKMKLLKSYSEDTLIVIDNFDHTKDYSGKYVSAIFDKKFSDVRSGKYHIIFTSRIRRDDGCIELEKLEGVYQNELFFKYYTKEPSDDDRQAINGILDIIGGHTLTLVLIAKTLFNGRRVSLRALLEKLSANLKTDIPVNVTHEKDGEVRSGLMYTHIESIFDLEYYNLSTVRNCKEMIY